jgi:hypothetical protein
VGCPDGLGYPLPTFPADPRRREVVFACANKISPVLHFCFALWEMVRSAHMPQDTLGSTPAHCAAQPRHHPEMSMPPCSGESKGYDSVWLGYFLGFLILRGKRESTIVSDDGQLTMLS